MRTMLDVWRTGLKKEWCKLSVIHCYQQNIIHTYIQVFNLVNCIFFVRYGIRHDCWVGVQTNTALRLQVNKHSSPFTGKHTQPTVYRLTNTTYRLQVNKHNLPWSCKQKLNLNVQTNPAFYPLVNKKTPVRNKTYSLLVNRNSN